MSNQIKMTGFVSAECEARTLGDLRALVKWCDKYRVGDEAPLDWGMGTLFVDLTGKQAASAAWIECGDHLVGDEHWDLLIDTHTHREQNEPAPFDWPTKDRLNRYGDETRPE